LSAFADRAVIRVEAGHGGPGAISFRREKYVPKGGPDGGDGGKGGSILLIVDKNVRTLLDFQADRLFRADKGGQGSGQTSSGKDGKDLRIRVPQGTVVVDADTDEPLADLVDGDAVWVAARGGIGGRGNARFATATNQAPRRADTGMPGESRTLRLELKLVADCGLVGFPNAGKSTLIAAVSGARPKIADYPFTTLSPNLGVVTLSDDRSFVVADVPGLIEGAHAGHGLGDKFLRHIERTKVLVHLVDVSGASGRDPVLDFDTILEELRLFDAKVAAKPMIVAATKMDAVDDPPRVETLERHVRDRGLPFFRISAVAGTGLDDLLEAMWRQIAAVREMPVPAA